MKNQSDDDGIAIAVTTDDCLISHSSNDAGKKHLNDLLAAMTKAGWKYTFDAVVHHMLGIDFEWPSDIPGALILRTPSKILDLKEHFFDGVADSDIPKVYEAQLPSWSITARETSPPIDPTVYRKALGLVPYNTKCRNEIKQVYSLLSKYSHTPTQLDYDALKHIAAYLFTTRQLGLCFHPASSVHGNTSTTLVSATDCSWDRGHTDSKSSIATLHKIGDLLTDPSAPYCTTSNFETNGPSTSAMIGEAKGMMKGANHLVVARGIANDLQRPQSAPTVMHQDNMAVVTRLKYLSPTKEATKAHARMLNYLRYLVEEGYILPTYISTKLQPADPMTKPTGALDNIRSLPMLQGHQPYIQQLREEYEVFRTQKRLFKNTSTTTELTQMLDEVVAIALSSPLADDKYPRFPFHLYAHIDDNPEVGIQDDNMGVGIQEAKINGIKNSSTFFSSKRTRYHYLPYFNSQIYTHNDEYPSYSIVTFSDSIEEFDFIEHNSIEEQFAT